MPLECMAGRFDDLSQSQVRNPSFGGFEAWDGAGIPPQVMNTAIHTPAEIAIVKKMPLVTLPQSY